MYINRVAKFVLLAVVPFAASCATEISSNSSPSALSSRSSRDNPDAPSDDAPAPVRDRAHVAQVRVPGAKVVGYYDMFSGSGQDYEVPPILGAGATAISIADPAAPALNDLNVLFVTNPDNSGYGFEYVSRLADIAAAVQAGMVLVIHDRAVFGASSILPAGAGFGIFSDFTDSADIDIRDGSTAVTANLNNASLDGGNASSHGFAADSTLPAHSKLILTTSTTSHIVTFCYPAGRGAVIYSTIPLDFYLQGSGNNPPRDAMRNTYATNIVKYAAAGACGVHGGPRPTPNVVH